MVYEEKKRREKRTRDNKQFIFNIRFTITNCLACQNENKEKTSNANICIRGWFWNGLKARWIIIDRYLCVCVCEYTKKEINSKLILSEFKLFVVLFMNYMRMDCPLHLFALSSTFHINHLYHLGCNSFYVLQSDRIRPRKDIWQAFKPSKEDFISVAQSGHNPSDRQNHTLRDLSAWMAEWQPQNYKKDIKV